MSEETGGPAFPINVDSEMTCLGITARDYFAAKALHFCLLKCWDDDGAAARAYRIADEMLKAREQ